MKELFLEIGTEEIPAGFIPDALTEMSTFLEKELRSLGIKPADIKTFGTPRRLVVSLAEVAEKEDDASMQVLGPAKKAAFDDKGNVSKAAEGFAKSQGVDVSDLKVVETPKGEYLALQKEVKGRKTVDLLQEAMPKLISSIPFRKSMRWGNLDVRFARPVHWIVALYGGEVIPFTFGDVKSGSESRGHRFMAPDKFKVSGLSDYVDKEKDTKLDKAFVIVDQEKRRYAISKQVNELASSVNGYAMLEVDLLETVTFINEYPVGVLGSFDKEFLKLPEDVLITSMREHQKYFHVRDNDFKLLPYFITMSNTKAKNMNVVKAGNERVLRARLSDARFFYEEDRKVPLKERVEKLKGIVFQAKLGTYYEKVFRIGKLCIIGLGQPLNITNHYWDGLLEGILQNPIEKDIDNKIRNAKLLARAAMLCKADLTTGMVGEFPNLQGIMGREYARLSGEDIEVADAINEHYLPRFAADSIPATDLGAFLSIADRIDTICGCFGIGEVPTGTKDQFALRRHTIAIINIILARDYKISLSTLVDKSLELLAGKITRPAAETKKDVMEYIKVRLQNILTSDGYPVDVVDAVLSADFDDIVTSVEIIKAIADLKKSPEFEPIAITFKRVANIIKGTNRTPIDASLFQHGTEQELYDKSENIKKAVSLMLRFDKELLNSSTDFKAAFSIIAGLKDHVDAFFDGVMVMDKDEEIKNNRLALLWGVSDIFSRFADFSKITTNGN